MDDIFFREILPKNKTFFKLAMSQNLETKCKKAVLRIADVVEEMNLKLCHIIENMKDFRNSLYWTGPRGSYNQDYRKSEYEYYNENENTY